MLADRTEAERGGTVNFTLTGLSNANGTAADQCIIEDTPPQGLTFDRGSVPAFTNGAGVTYSVVYSTNLSGGDTTLYTNMPADKPFTFDAPTLQPGEYITSLRLVFSAAPTDFAHGDSIVYTFHVDADAAQTSFVNGGNVTYDGNKSDSDATVDTTDSSAVQLKVNKTLLDADGNPIKNNYPFYVRVYEATLQGGKYVNVQRAILSVPAGGGAVTFNMRPGHYYTIAEDAADWYSIDGIDLSTGQQGTDSYASFPAPTNGTVSATVRNSTSLAEGTFPPIAPPNPKAMNIPPVPDLPVGSLAAATDAPTSAPDSIQKTGESLPWQWTFGAVILLGGAVWLILARRRKGQAEK